MYRVLHVSTQLHVLFFIFTWISRTTPATVPGAGFGGITVAFIVGVGMGAIAFREDMVALGAIDTSSDPMNICCRLGGLPNAARTLAPIVFTPHGFKRRETINGREYLITYVHQCHSKCYNAIQ